MSARVLRRWLVGACLALSLAPAGCSSSSDEAEASPSANAPLMVVKSDSGAVTAEVRTGPTQPPERGVITVELTLSDATGKPIDGLTVAAKPWMPAMGHGASVEPTVTAEGGGRYLIGNVACFMAGTWEIRTTLTGPVNDRLTVSLDVR